MAAVDDLAAFYDTVDGDAELCTVQGVPNVAGIFSTVSEVLLGEAVVQAPTLRLPGTVVAAGGGQCVIRGSTYKILAVQDLPPDGREHLLVLVKL